MHSFKLSYMKRFGLIGHPIAHSLSPALFKAGYDGRYPYELIETSDFEDAYGRFLQEYDGINVTAPFKELAFRKADILSEECQRIGATNLLIKTPEGIKAYNSDFLGVRLWLEEVAMPFFDGHSRPDRKAQQRRDTRVSKTFEESRSRPTTLVVGLGGAGKAAAEAARSLGCRTILMNRTRHSEEIRPLEDFCRCFREADIIIYNIPTAIPQLDELTDDDFRGLPIKGPEDERVPSLIHRPKFILEANYKNPSFTESLIERMKAVNPDIGYTSGRTWLLYQALTGYELFTGEKPDLAQMSAVI